MGPISRLGDRKPQTLNPKPYTSDPKPVTLNPTVGGGALVLRIKSTSWLPVARTPMV